MCSFETVGLAPDVLQGASAILGKGYLKEAAGHSCSACGGGPCFSSGKEEAHASVAST